MPKKIEKGDPLGFFNIHRRKTSKKWREDPVGQKILKKASQCQTK